MAVLGALHKFDPNNPPPPLLNNVKKMCFRLGWASIGWLWTSVWQALTTEMNICLIKKKVECCLAGSPDFCRLKQCYMHKPLPFPCDLFVNLNEWTEGDDVWSPPITNIDLAGNVEKRLDRLIGRQRAAAGSHGSALPPPAPTQLLPLCFSRLPQVLPWFNKGNFLSSPKKSRRRAAGCNMQGG